MSLRVRQPCAPGQALFAGLLLADGLRRTYDELGHAELIMLPMIFAIRTSLLRQACQSRRRRLHVR